MHFLKEILDGVESQWAHSIFTRYSRGNFVGPSCRVKSGKEYCKIKSSYEYSTPILQALANSSKGEIKISGNVFARGNFKEAFEDAGISVGKVKKKGSLHIIEIDGHLDAAQLGELVENTKDSFYLVKATGVQDKKAKLRCKKKPPKPGSKPDEGFCTANIPNAGWKTLSEQIFTSAEKIPREASISNAYSIKSLEGSDEIRADPARFRLEAKRTGIIKRLYVSDGDSSEKEYKISV